MSLLPLASILLACLLIGSMILASNPIERLLAAHFLMGLFISSLMHKKRSKITQKEKTYILITTLLWFIGASIYLMQQQAYRAASLSIITGTIFCLSCFIISL